MDKYRGITRLPLVESRINHLLGRLSANQAIGSYQTQQELLRAYADISFRILEGFDKRLYELPSTKKGNPVSEEDINLYLLGVYSEILYLLDAVRRTAEMTEENFNFAIASIRNLQSGMKYCRQQLSTYSLYATQFGDALNYGETFSNQTNIDTGSDLLGDDECFIDTVEGTASLPRLKQVDQWNVSKITVGANSNGALGNNVEAKTPIRGSIKSITDGKVDTWTEYENVVDSENITGLKLELKIALEDVQIVNAIKIHPVFLGARTPIAIRSIDVSPDGREWISLKNDVRVADFLDEDPEGRYHLSPHSSRFAGEFNITFAPRFVKFIRLLFRQSSSFPIVDINGRHRLRYAIGLKEISIFGHKYASVGELISNPIEFSRNISVLGIQSLVDPPLLVPEIGGVEYYISYDDGASWVQITSLKEDSLTIPEVLYPPEGTTSIRYKLHVHKDELAFSELTSAIQSIPFVEKFGWVARRPFTLNLLHKPQVGTVTICDPHVASRGIVYPRASIGQGVSSQLVEEPGGGAYHRHGNTELRIRLPLKTVKDPSTLRIYINNSRWAKLSNVSDFSNQFTQAFIIARSSDDEGFEIIFGNNSATAPAGAIPGSADNISMFLDEENCVIEGFSEPYKLKLDYPSDGVKENTKILFNGGVYEAASQTMPSGITKFKLKHENILINETWDDSIPKLRLGIRDSDGNLVLTTYSHAILPPVTGSFRTFQSFVDGDSELSSTGDWTCDPLTGWVYTNTATEQDKEYIFSYSWADKKELNTNDWRFVDGSLQEIEILESGYKTKEGSGLLFLDFGVARGDKSLQITDDNSEVIRGIVAKSFRVTGGTLGDARAFEIPFINGREEFASRAAIQDETISSFTSGVDSIGFFRLTHWQNIVPTADPLFSEGVPGTVFKVAKDNYASLLIQGDYFFDALGTYGGVGYIYVHMGGIGTSMPPGHTVSYQYYDEFSRERMRGSYSIDAVEGRVYFAEPLTSADIQRYISFKYTPYTVRYNISLQLQEGRDYTVDSKNKRISILPAATGSKEQALVVNYKYTSETLRTLDLGPYFSPLVRALNIRVS